MSTIASTNIKHPSSATNNITLASTGAVAINGAMTGAGLDLVTLQSFSAVSSISVNNCFSSTYDNYLLLLSLTGGTTEGIIGLRLRASGSDATGANYDFQNLSATSTTVSGARTTASTLPRFSFFDNGDPGAMTVLNMYGPAIAAPTFYISQTTTRIDGADAIRIINDSGRHSLSTAYDGISIICQSTGNITGTVRIYGYKNS